MRAPAAPRHPAGARDPPPLVPPPRPPVRSRRRFPPLPIAVPPVPLPPVPRCPAVPPAPVVPPAPRGAGVTGTHPPPRCRSDRPCRPPPSCRLFRAIRPPCRRRRWSSCPTRSRRKRTPREPSTSDGAWAPQVGVRDGLNRVPRRADNVALVRHRADEAASLAAARIGGSGDAAAGGAAVRCRSRSRCRLPRGRELRRAPRRGVAGTSPNDRDHHPRSRRGWGCHRTPPRRQPAPAIPSNKRRPTRHVPSSERHE